MSKKVEISYIWKGKEVTIEASMAPAEHDVGIMNPHPDGMRVLDLDGLELTLSEDEYNTLYNSDDVYERLVEAYYE